MRIFKHLVLTLSAVVLQACDSKSGQHSIVADNPEQGPLNVFDVNLYALNKVVCDPFDPGQPGPNDGLIATLHYRGAGQARWYDVQSYIDQGVKSPRNLFFSSLDIPTRVFSLGFPSETGASVQDDAGQVLNEYFALSFSSVLKLDTPDEEGEYELALLSDDGTVMKIRQTDGTYKTVVSNDGDHPTRLGCGDRITMTRESEHLVQLNYYQGPRYHISLIPMWRKVTASTQAEPLCGQLGNNLFFDYNNNSAPRPAYNQLLSRGWKPIAAGNWNLPAYAIFNPCTTGHTPVISNFRLENVEGVVTAMWNTDIPATSQLLYKNVATGAEVLTNADNRLRVSHQQVVLFSGLQIGQTYDFQAISISADYGKGLSNTIRLKVQ